MCTPSDATTYGWPVKVYRHTKDRGWENALTNDAAGNSNHQPILATPCVGGVEIRQFRVRIRVFPKKRQQEGLARCTKRRNLLFVSTRSQTGSIVLAFPTIALCNEFFDELLDLNDRKVVAEKPPISEQDEADTQQRKQDTMSYLARLLHDKDFSHFVKNIEESLVSTDDGARMLMAFQASGDDEQQVV